ncbi:IS3 family transposase, partial [Pseudomonas aeruginosa]|uniref:IS3 family transposase n=1 Tax=Pseudomonas aeruginosa TaxID=287 RepID=UPI001F301BF8
RGTRMKNLLEQIQSRLDELNKAERKVAEVILQNPQQATRFSIVAESFFQLLKRERIRRKIYTTREEARSDIFDYIEMFYNPKRRHSSAMQLSPVEYEKRYFLSLESV